MPLDGLHPKHRQSRSWVQRYARAMKSEDVTTLQALHKGIRDAVANAGSTCVCPALDQRLSRLVLAVGDTRLHL